jgi:hypothetical protein
MSVLNVTFDIILDDGESGHCQTRHVGLTGHVLSAMPARHIGWSHAGAPMVPSLS